MENQIPSDAPCWFASDFQKNPRAVYTNDLLEAEWQSAQVGKRHK